MVATTGPGQRAGGAGTATWHHLPGPLSLSQRRVLDLLAALGDVEVHSDRIAELVGIPDARPVLEGLRSKRLVEGDGERYRLTAAPVAGAGHEQIPVMERVLDHVAWWCEQSERRSGEVVEELELVLSALDWAAGQERWREVLRVVRAVDGALALSRRWGAWEAVLDRGLAAARALGDESSEAWALHQLGTRALGLGDSSSARRHLGSALALREMLGDRSGAAVTRRNLELSEVAARAS